MAKRKKPTLAYAGPVFDPGDRVRLKRPNLWWGHTGVVQSVTPASGDHVVRIKVNTFFSVAAKGTDMEKI